MSDHSDFNTELSNKEFRVAFVSSQIDIGLPFQIKCLRDQRKWSQKKLADEANMLQPRISAIEKPGGTTLNLETLKRLASAFDVALIVKFVPFSDLVRWSDEFDPNTFNIKSFDEELVLSSKICDEIDLSSNNTQLSSDKTDPGTPKQHALAFEPFGRVLRFPMRQSNSTFCTSGIAENESLTMGIL